MPSPQAAAAHAATREITVSIMEYPRPMSILRDSMPTKCMDHTPIPPKAMPAMLRWTRLFLPDWACIRCVADSAAYEPTTEIRYARTTRGVLYAV
ncbi:hypothetical protein D3C78_1415640 [compost metagenome]